MIVKSCFDISYNIKVDKVSCKMIGVRSVKNEEILQFGVKSINFHSMKSYNGWYINLDTIVMDSNLLNFHFCYN